MAYFYAYRGSTEKTNNGRYYTSVRKEIEVHFISNQEKDLFKKIKVITRSFKHKAYTIKDKDGTVTTGLDTVLEVWKQYCEDLYKNYILMSEVIGET